MDKRPGNFRTGRRGHRPEAVVIHIMDGSLIGTDSWFNDPKSSVSAHYGIGRKGEVHQYVKEIDSTFHAGTVDVRGHTFVAVAVGEEVQGNTNWFRNTSNDYL